MFNYENTSASDFKVFTSINHVRFAHSWVDKKNVIRDTTGFVLVFSHTLIKIAVH
jgi:hypothetical protein